MRRWVMAALLGMLLGGCGSETSFDGPPQVALGQAECLHCGMLVSDTRFAAAMVVDDAGKRRDLAFDDIGDMFEYERAGKVQGKIVRRYAGDHATGGWIAADTATYVRSEKIHTPMGSGIVAFAEAAAAERKRAEVEGEVLTSAQLASGGAATER